MYSRAVATGGCTLSQDDVHSSLTDMASWKSSRLMTFDSSNLHVKTHFNDHLVVLLREVREPLHLGCGSAVCFSSACRSASLIHLAPPQSKLLDACCFGASLGVATNSHSLLCAACTVQVRQLQSLGFIVKREILTEVETANKFYRWVPLNSLVKCRMWPEQVDPLNRVPAHRRIRPGVSRHYGNT
jgi:hypothetical protein